MVCQALEDYTSIVQRHPGLAVTEYARLSRALMLFQTGRPADAVLQLDDLRVSMLGCDVSDRVAIVITPGACAASTSKVMPQGEHAGCVL